MREKGEYTVPMRLGDELEYNPFLRWNSMEIRTKFGLNKDTDNVQVWKALRKAKDMF